VKRLVLPLALSLSMLACSGSEPSPSSTPTENNTAGDVVANVTGITVSGEPGSYTFSVEIESPDTGCEQYADWWEVVSPDGALIYRRILAHSHVDEQPFTRSGGPVMIQANERVIVRAHMNTGGYGGVAREITPDGSIEGEISLEEDFASDLASASPLPDGCAF